ncbi:hypothetical protein H4R20_000635 [Coemansia guatemalensis]|uniref:Uncharacterized protein n=1 Tax=Coemansia guatemalensis TaxID=2761395 RepID=A0A9W8I121_9FUNG|nr:hypothetical protein H4R20_000635 [Coemansia guatemalensis]
MYSPAHSDGQSSESVESSTFGGDTLNSRLMPRGTHTGDEELVFRNDSSKSKAVQNHSYMASISTGQKARNTMMSGSTTKTGSHSANSSSTSVNQPQSPRSASAAGHYGARSSHSRGPGRGTPGAGVPAASVPNSPPVPRDYSDVPGKRRPHQQAQAGHQRRPSIDARGYLRALNDLFFSKFCVDELFYREFREQLVSRIQDSTFRYSPGDLQDILDDVLEACKSTRLRHAAGAGPHMVRWAAEPIWLQWLPRHFYPTLLRSQKRTCSFVYIIEGSPPRFPSMRLIHLRVRVFTLVPVCACASQLNLDVVSQWRLNYFARDQSASVIDHIFLINANMMVYDPKHSSVCLDVFCADPLCSEIHAGRVSEEDKAKAFRRVLNVVLNETLRVRLISKEQKTAVRARLLKSVYSTEDRISAVRELAVLVMLAQDERHRDVVAYAIDKFGKAWAQSNTSVTDVDEDCNLDPDMVYRKALGVINNTYLESILDVRRLGMSISAEEVGKLRELWGRNSTRVPDSRVLTLPMLLHLLVHCSESELQEALPQAGVSGAAMAKAGETGGLSGRIEQVEDAALQIVQNLGLAWELGDNPPRDLRQFCMVLLLDLGSALSMLLVQETQSPADAAADSDAREIGVVEDGLFAKWWEVCDAVIRFERAHRRFYAAFLVMYIKITSERLLSQKADFDPELFLSMVIELLTEYRKRRPDYEAIVLTADGRLSAAIAAAAAAAAAATSTSGDVAAKKAAQQLQQQAGKALDRRTREDIGSEFDRLFAWVDQQLPVTNHVRALARAPSPKSRAPSWQIPSAEKMRSSSSASIGYSSSTGGNRVASPLPPVPTHSLSKDRL